MNQNFDWDVYIRSRIESAETNALERVIAHVLSLDEGKLRDQGLEAIDRAAKTVCMTPVALHLLLKYTSKER